MRFLVALAFAVLAVSGPAWSKNFAVPSNDPSILLTIPDSWKTDTIDFGYNALSPGEDIFFSVEFAGKNDFDKMMKNNDKWMEQREFTEIRGPGEVDLTLGGIQSKLLAFRAKDDGDETQIDFVFIPAKKGRLVMLTIEGSPASREKHKEAINSIMNSIKALD